MFDMSGIGRWLVIFGLGIVLVGGLLWAAGRLGLPLGRLPGDIAIERGNVSVFFPCATSIILSLVLTVVLNVVLRWFNR